MENHSCKYTCGLSAVGFLATVAYAMNIACTPRMGRDIAHAVIDLALAACVAENPDKSEPELKAICHYADDLAPVVHELIGAQKKGVAKAGVCK
jgi:hypothetical protein